MSTTRPSATRVLLAAPDEDNIWVATDTGMILKLSQITECIGRCFIHSQFTSTPLEVTESKQDKC